MIDFSNISDTARRRAELAVSVVVVLIILYVMWKMVYVLVPYAVSAGIAFLIMPLVNSLALRLPMYKTRPRLAKALSAGIASFIVLSLAGAGLGIMVFRVIEDTPALVEQVPGLVEEVQNTWDQIEQTYRERVPDSIQELIEPQFESARSALISSATDSVWQALRVLSNGVSLIIALAGAPVIIFYLLYDAQAIGRGIMKLLPSPLRRDLTRIGNIAGTVILTYLRTQLVMGIFVGITIGLALWALGVPSAAALGILAGLGELIPVVGPLTSFVVAVVVLVFTNPRLIPVAAVLYGAVQFTQNTLVVPRVQGHATGLHPLGVMLSLAVFGFLWGFWGVLIAVPSAAAAYRIQSYIRKEWNCPGSWKPDKEKNADETETSESDIVDSVG